MSCMYSRICNLFVNGTKLLRQVNECISWNRGIVTKVYAGGKIKVLFIDYGETVKLDPTKNECHKCIMFDGNYNNIQFINKTSNFLGGFLGHFC